MWDLILTGLMIAAAIGLVALAVIYRNNLILGWARAKKFFKEVAMEMRSVAWPTRQEVINATIMVAVLSFIMVILIGASDWVLTYLVRALFNIG